MNTTWTQPTNMQEVDFPEDFMKSDNLSSSLSASGTGVQARDSEQETDAKYLNPRSSKGMTVVPVDCHLSHVQPDSFGDPTILHNTLCAGDEESSFNFPAKNSFVTSSVAERNNAVKATEKFIGQDSECGDLENNSTRAKLQPTSLCIETSSEIANGFSTKNSTVSGTRSIDPAGTGQYLPSQKTRTVLHLENDKDPSPHLNTVCVCVCVSHMPNSYFIERMHNFSRLLSLN